MNWFTKFLWEWFSFEPEEFRPFGLSSTQHKIRDLEGNVAHFKQKYENLLKDHNGLIDLHIALEKQAEGFLLEIYKDKPGQWRWRLKAANNKILCESSESYKTASALNKTLTKIIDVIPYVEVRKETARKTAKS